MTKLYGLLVAAALAITSFAATAQAADVGSGRTYTRTTNPGYDWTGFYVGITGGYGMWDATYSDTSGIPPTGLPSTKGWAVGGFAGINYQISRVVVGLEADVLYSPAKYSLDTATCAFCTTTDTASVPWSGTARARIAYAFDRILPYVTGGLAWGNVKTSTSTTFGPFGSTSSYNDLFSVGWAAGLGLDYALTDNIGLGVLYLHTDLGLTKTGWETVGGPMPASFDSRSGMTEDKFLLRLWAKF